MPDRKSKKLSLRSSAIHGHHIPVRAWGVCSSGVPGFFFPVLSVLKVTTKAIDRGIRWGLELGMHEWFWTWEGIATPPWPGAGLPSRNEGTVLLTDPAQWQVNTDKHVQMCHMRDGLYRQGCLPKLVLLFYVIVVF